MKKTLLALLLILAFGFFGSVTARAETTAPQESLDELKDAVSDEIKDDLQAIGADPSDPEKADLRFSTILQLLVSKLAENAKRPLTCCLELLASLLLIAPVNLYRDGLRRIRLSEMLELVCALFICVTVAKELVAFVREATSLMKTVSDFMLLYVPIMLSLIAFSGHVVSSGGYQVTILSACEIVSRIATTLIRPLLCVYLSFCVCCGFVPSLRLSGVRDWCLKLMKWTLAFLMSLFSAVLSIKSFISGAADSVGSRAVRLTLSSLIPIVGAAVSEAYRTVSASVSLLKCGVGVFVILVVLLSFLPIFLKCLVWMLSMQLCAAVSRCFSLTGAGELLESLSGAIGVLMAASVSVAMVFIISSAALMTVGGAS